MTGDGERLDLLGTLTATAFEVRVSALSPGCGGAFDETQWRDALVEIESGVLELELTSGQRWSFGTGEILWLTGLPIRALHNPGAEPCIVVAAWRGDSGRIDQPNPVER
jgi:hypothetical protein